MILILVERILKSIDKSDFISKIPRHNKMNEMRESYYKRKKEIHRSIRFSKVSKKYDEFDHSFSPLETNKCVQVVQSFPTITPTFSTSMETQHLADR